jgi:hypothetical protein
MDEAVAGFASRIEIRLEAGNRLTVSDNGRGIPVDSHPKFPGKSALEVILTTLHSGGKFTDKAYATSGGLHGVGISVVNALSTETIVEVARNKELFRQTFSKGLPTSDLVRLGSIQNRRGTTVSFVPDAGIFGEEAKFKPARLYRLARSKAYLFAGVEIRWHCDAELITDDTPARGGVPISRRPVGSPQGAGGRPRMRHRRVLPRPAGLSRMGKAQSNGRSPGRSGAKAGLLITATPSRPRMAALTNRASDRP